MSKTKPQVSINLGSYSNRYMDLNRKQQEEDYRITKEYYNNTNPTELETILYHLKKVDLSIRPYSLWWRCGYKKSIKKAIKIVEEVINGK